MERCSKKFWCCERRGECKAPIHKKKWYNPENPQTLASSLELTSKLHSQRSSQEIGNKIIIFEKAISKLGSKFYFQGSPSLGSRWKFQFQKSFLESKLKSYFQEYSYGIEVKFLFEGLSQNCDQNITEQTLNFI